MKKLICSVLFFAFIANVSAQLEVDAAGNTRVAGDLYPESDSNFIVTTNNVPITFKVNGVLAGYTGNSVRNNVSFGYNALYANTTGDFNTASVAYALSYNTTGSENSEFPAGIYLYALIADGQKVDIKQRILTK